MQIVIPAVWYDAIQKQAELYGGIGSHQFETDSDVPLCAYGLLAAGCPTPGPCGGLMGGSDFTVNHLLRGGQLPFHPSISDKAVDRVRFRLGLPVAGETPDRRAFDSRSLFAYEVRVPFDLWAEEMEIVRGN